MSVPFRRQSHDARLWPEHPEGIAVDATNVYWTNWNGGTVMSVRFPRQSNDFGLWPRLPWVLRSTHEHLLTNNDSSGSVMNCE